jgi:multidrug efflux pump subunit AcrA (membrane-fusion protein)
VAVPKSTRSGWGRAGHRRAVLIGVVVFGIVLGGGVGAWAAVSRGDTQYRMADVTRADIGTSLNVVGDVAPVNEATASFQVGGKVATVTAAPGQQVAAGQTLGTLDTTALTEDVSSAESTLSANEAKLVADEENQSTAVSSSSNNNSSSNKPQGSSPPSTSTTTTTAPTRNGSGSGSGGPNPTVTADQTTLTQDQSTLSTDQQKEAADLTQAQSDCTSAKTGTATGQATCEAALQTVSADETQVSKDQAQVSKDEAALAEALAAESSGGGGSGGGGSSPTQSGHADSNAQQGVTGNSGAGTGNGATGSSSGGDGNTNSGGGNSSGTGGSAGSGGSATTSTDTPEQIASDQAAIDTAQANLTEAQQALDGATLSSPISGTVVSVGINVGDTVSANSSSEVISIIGTKSYEVQATLDSTQVPSVKVGQSAAVSVDGVGGTMDGTVSQVGPVQSTSSGYSYPVVIALPGSATGLYPGSTANVVISTGEVNNVVAVPTSAVQSLGSRAYVLELDKGTLTRKVITIGMVGDVYTQVDSGLTPGQSVVLADYAEAVPSSNTNSVGGLGNFLGGGGGAGGFFGGGGGSFRGGGGQFQANIGTAKG